MLKPVHATCLPSLGQRFRPALMTFFLRRTGDRAEAEDLTHDVLVRISEREATIDPERPDGYIFQSAANILRDRARRLRVRATYLQGLGVAEGAKVDELDPERTVAARHSLAAIVATLGELPPRTRDIFLLFRLEGMKQREIADRFGISVRTVEQHVSRATAALRQHLEKS